MTPRETATLVLGVLGIYLLGDSIAEVGSAAFYMMLDPADEALAEMYENQGVATAIWGALKVSFGAGLIVLRQPLASRLAPAPGEAPSPSSVSTGLQSALFAVLGVYFLVKGPSALIGGFAQLPTGSSVWELWPHYAAPIAEALLGLGLFLGGGALAGLWHSARQAGRDRSAV